MEAIDDPEKLQSDLYYREQVRRRAIWRLQDALREYQVTCRTRKELGMDIHGLAPVETLKACLAIFAEIERCDRDYPVGPAASWSADQLATVPVVVHGGRVSIVRDVDIPEPWLSRVEAASALSERIPEGFYAWDWEKFVRLWKDEQANIEHIKKVVAMKWPDSPAP